MNTKTTANKLAQGNGTDRILENEKNKLPEPFNNKQSLFHTISIARIENFPELVSLFPEFKGPEPRLRDKLVRNHSDVINDLNHG